MIRQIEVFETADGERFDNEARALEHIADMCREIIDKALHANPKFGERFTRNETFQIVMALVPDAAAAKSLTGKLRMLTDY